jgi:hypothetical protein
VVLGKQSIPLERVTLLVTFGDTSNYRTEMLAFEVFDFSWPYQVILVRSCYVKFMVIPSYAYLKLKIPGPTVIITVEAKIQRALDCEQSSIELAVAMVTVAELTEFSLWLPTAPLSPDVPPVSGVFKTNEDAKVVHINAGNPAKILQIEADLDPK